MSHTVHTTHALVLSRFPKKEADMVFHLYTRDFGRIEASATGIRLLKSKLRYALQTHSIASVSLVRGRHEWRIVNATPLSLTSNPHPHTLSIFALLRRLIVGEIVDPDLFDRILSSLTASPLHHHRGALYYSTGLFMLYRLGYFSPDSPEAENVLLKETSPEILEEFSVVFPEAPRLLNDTLSRTHL